MARFFFHIHDGQDFEDEVGTNLSSISQARQQALLLAGQMLHGGAMATPRTGAEWVLQVTDDAASPVFTLRISVDDGLSLPQTQIS